MVVLRELRRRARLIAGPVFGMALTGYFAYHLIEGDRGLLAWVQLTKQIHAADRRLAALEDQHKALGRKVSELTPDHLDPDLLDQQVRSVLDFAAPSEVVIMRGAPAN
ncbi:MAG TPA: septum formation initiator family protein [Stellaceae bacterium]|nr:septum formation initiator family protein [Stellaceae bacterium]